jgi:hypothetical protein
MFLMKRFKIELRLPMNGVLNYEKIRKAETVCNGIVVHSSSRIDVDIGSHKDDECKNKNVLSVVYIEMSNYR